MSIRKDFTLGGVGADLQFGKAGGRMQWVTDHWEPTAADGTTLAQVRVPLLPVNASDAASKSYIDSVASGLDAKDSVKVTTTANLATLSGLLTIDGITVVAGDRVLVKNQTIAKDNGIYVTASGAWTRSSDADATGKLTGGSFVFVEQGTTLGDTGWVVSTNGSPVIGTDVIAFVQFSSAGVVQAGVGLSKTGTTLNANIGATTITVDGTNNFIVNSSATANQVMLSAGTIGTEASFGALPLGNTASVTGLLAQAHGGLNTDVSTFATGSLFVQNATGSVVTELAIGTAGNSLIVAAGAPTWGTVNLTDNVNAVTGILKEANGGTNQSTYVQGDMLIATATNTLGKLALGASGNILQSNGTDIVWGVPLAVTGSKMTIEGDITYNGGATQLIGTVPAGGRVTKVSFIIGTAWDKTETVVIGDAGVTNRLMVATANDPEQPFIFSTDVNNLYAGATVINATVSNTLTPTTGAAHVIVEYISA